MPRRDTFGLERSTGPTSEVKGTSLSGKGSFGTAAANQAAREADAANARFAARGQEIAAQRLLRASGDRAQRNAGRRAENRRNPNLAVNQGGGGDQPRDEKGRWTR